MNYIPLIFVAALALMGWVYPQQHVNFGGTKIAIFQGGTGTTTAPISQLLYAGSSTYQSVATTSAVCSGSVSCSAFTVIGLSPITITGGANPFTQGSYYGQSVSATSTALRLTGTPFSLFASSTALFSYASSTQFGANAIYFTGPTPTLGTCGTASITASSTDARGTIVVTGGTPTTCNITFSAVKPDTPTCIAGTNSVSLLSDVAAASSSGVQFGLSAVFSGDIFYICLQ